jgi:ribosomal protein L14E/L6E/L27E
MWLPIFNEKSFWILYFYGFFKRVVFLKQLQSGLLLVTGPYKVNGCPLRRINQKFVIATRTKVELSKVTVPDNLNDKFFDRVKAKKSKTTEAEIFETKKEVFFNYILNKKPFFYQHSLPDLHADRRAQDCTA